MKYNVLSINFQITRIEDVEFLSQMNLYDFRSFYYSSIKKYNNLDYMYKLNNRLLDIINNNLKINSILVFINPSFISIRGKTDDGLLELLHYSFKDYKIRTLDNINKTNIASYIRLLLNAYYFLFYETYSNVYVCNVLKKIKRDKNVCRISCNTNRST